VKRLLGSSSRRTPQPAATSETHPGTLRHCLAAVAGTAVCEALPAAYQRHLRETMQIPQRQPATQRLQLSNLQGCTPITFKLPRCKTKFKRYTYNYFSFALEGKKPPVF